MYNFFLRQTGLLEYVRRSDEVNSYMIIKIKETTNLKINLKEMYSNHNNDCNVRESDGFLWRILCLLRFICKLHLLMFYNNSRLSSCIDPYPQKKVDTMKNSRLSGKIES